MKLFFTLAVFTVFLSFSHAQSIDFKKIDSLFEVLDHQGMAKGSVAISLNGKTAYSRSVGCSVSEPTYRVGSVSKMFTAVMIFQLVDEGKLRLSDKLATFFPQLPNASDITISHLLHHRSGLHDYTRDTNFSDWMDKAITREELLSIIARKGADFTPNAKADYSNSNYLLLSYIIEKLSGASYEETLHKRIITKAKLKHTSYGKPIELTSYKYANGQWNPQKATHSTLHSGAGSIISTPSDLNIFIEQLFGMQLISGNSLKSMTTMIDGYGMGMFPYNFSNVKGYGHNGRIEEFYSAVRYYPSRKLSISYVANGVLYPRIDIIDGILKICFNKPYSIPFSSTGNDLDKYVGTYAGDLPFKVVCSKESEKLILNAGGKTMEVRAIAPHYFMNAEAGTFFEFDPAKGKLLIKETDNVYLLKKEIRPS